jgi:hypothetical protein
LAWTKVFGVTIDDPIGARLAAGGTQLTLIELAREAEISAPTASLHLTKLLG